VKQNPSTQVQPTKDRGRIRILATSDLHMHLTGFDYYADTPDPTLGLTRTASLIRKARHEATDALVLIFDNGDSLQGTPMGEWAIRNDNPHPMMQAFKALDYDAIGLGNHDFGFGLPTLDKTLAQAPCPVLCGNLHRSGEQQSWQRFTILDRVVRVGNKDVPIRVGVFSVLPPQTTRWEEHNLNETVAADDIVVAARSLTRILREKGCDLIVALAHSGLGHPDAATDTENAVIPLAAIEGIDAVVAGHTHLTLPARTGAQTPNVDYVKGLVHGTPVVMPGSAGAYLGVIDLAVTLQPQSGLRVADSHAELRPVSVGGTAIGEDLEIAHLVEPAHQQTRQDMAAPVARVSDTLHSYFSFCAPDRGLTLVAAAQAAALRPFLHGTTLAELPLLSAASPAKCGGRSGPRHYTDVPPGEICLRHVADLHVFPNELRAVQITGAQLLEWLEMSASAFNQQFPDAEAELFDRDRAGYNFDVIFGLSYQIDPSQPARYDVGGQMIHPGHRRVHHLTCAGQAVQPDQAFVVALDNYRASGGGHFPHVSSAPAIDLSPLDIRDILRDYMTHRLPPDPLARQPYPFSLMPKSGGTTILRTGPGALKYVDELNRFAPKILEPDENGFARIRLTL
jgi:2',3'-cyclic-nucleotide 2'-phosphodiesterase/3'-nucleotidase